MRLRTLRPALLAGLLCLLASGADAQTTFVLENPLLITAGRRVPVEGAPLRQEAFGRLVIDIPGEARYIVGDAPFEGAQVVGEFEGGSLVFAVDGVSVRLNGRYPILGDARRDAYAIAGPATDARGPARVSLIGGGAPLAEERRSAERPQTVASPARTGDDRAERQRLEREVDRLGLLLAEATAERDRLARAAADLDDAQARAATLQASAASGEARAAALETDLAETRATLAQTQADLAQVRESSRDAAALREELVGVQRAAASAETRAVEADARAAAAEAEREQVEAERQQTEASGAEADAALRQSRAEMARANAERERLQAQLADAQAAAVAEREAMIQAHAAALQRATERSAGGETARDSLEAQTLSAQEARLRAQLDTDAAQSRLAIAVAERDALRAQRDALAAERDALLAVRAPSSPPEAAARVTALQSERDAALAEASRLRTALASAQAQSAQQADPTEALQAERDSLNAELLALRAERQRPTPAAPPLATASPPREAPAASPLAPGTGTVSLPTFDFERIRNADDVRASLASAVYPPLAAQTGVAGDLLVLFQTDDTGAVIRTAVARPLGSGLDAVAEDIVRGMRFVPPTVDGQPTGLRSQILVRFGT